MSQQHVTLRVGAGSVVGLSWLAGAVLAMFATGGPGPSGAYALMLPAFFSAIVIGFIAFRLAERDLMFGCLAVPVGGLGLGLFLLLGNFADQWGRSAEAKRATELLESRYPGLLPDGDHEYLNGYLNDSWGDAVVIIDIPVSAAEIHFLKVLPKTWRVYYESGKERDPTLPPDPDGIETVSLITFFSPDFHKDETDAISIHAHGQKTVVLIRLGSALINPDSVKTSRSLGELDKEVQAERARLVGHWVCIDGPSYRGLLLRRDGTGSTQGADSRHPGTPLRWRVVKAGLVETMILGEEGEHGGCVPTPYRIQSDRLTLEKAVGSCTELKKTKDNLAQTAPAPAESDRKMDVERARPIGH